MHALSTEKIIKVQMHASISSGTFLYRPPPRSSSCLTTFTRVYYNTSAYMQHKVWISMNYILIPSFFPYQQRRGESFGQSRDVFCFGSRIEELSADRLYGFVAKEQGIFPGVSQDSVFPRKQRANLFYMY